MLFESVTVEAFGYRSQLAGSANWAIRLICGLKANTS